MTIPEPKAKRVVRVKFNRRYTWIPAADRRTSVRYPKDYEGPVKRECADAAIAAGAAVEVKTGAKPHRAAAVRAADA